MSHSSEPLAPAPPEPFVTGADPTEIMYGRTMLSVSQDEFTISLAMVGGESGGGYSHTGQNLWRTPRKFQALAPYYTDIAEMSADFSRLPTIKGLNRIKEEHLADQKDVADVALWLVDGAELSAKRFLAPVLSGAFPIANAPGEYIHDLADHGLGAITLPAVSFDVLRALVADANEFESQQTVDANNSVAVEFYYDVLARALDEVTMTALVDDKQPLGLIGEAMNGLNKTYYSIVKDLDPDHLRAMKELVRGRMVQAIEKHPVAVKDGEKMTALEWERRNLRSYYDKVSTLLGGQKEDHGDVGSKRKAGAGLSHRIFNKMRIT